MTAYLLVRPGRRRNQSDHRRITDEACGRRLRSNRSRFAGGQVDQSEMLSSTTLSNSAYVENALIGLTRGGAVPRKGVESGPCARRSKTRPVCRWKVIHLRDVHSTPPSPSAFCLPVAGRRDRPFFTHAADQTLQPLALAAPLAHPIALALRRDDRRVMGQSFSKAVVSFSSPAKTVTHSAMRDSWSRRSRAADTDQ